MEPLDVTPIAHPSRPLAPPAVIRPGARIVDDLDLAGLWSFLTAGEAPTSRTLWLAMLDEDSRAAPTVFPIADCPDEPGLDQLENLAELIRHLVEDGLAATVPALLARPGPTRMTDQDRRWASTVRTVIGPVTSCWPTFLLTSGGITRFAPDDLIVGRPRPGGQRSTAASTSSTAENSATPRPVSST